MHLVQVAKKPTEKGKVRQLEQQLLRSSPEPLMLTREQQGSQFWAYPSPLMQPAKGHEPYVSAPARSVVGGRTQLCAVFLR